MKSERKRTKTKTKRRGERERGEWSGASFFDFTLLLCVISSSIFRLCSRTRIRTIF